MEMEKKIFGTDGIRGQVGEWPITVDFLLKLGWAVGSILAGSGEAIVVIGKDTRISGYMIEAALEAGFSAAGVNTYLLGPLPTSAIAYLTRTFRADMGIVISASHNPFNDNGIKFFSAEGYKISRELEEKIEKIFSRPLITKGSRQLGKAWRIDDARGRYIEFCKSAVPHNTNLKNLKIILDCANGATYHIAPPVFRELGADVVTIHSEPDGYNINEDCGSVYPEALRKKVIAEKADVGIAFDGDGDRVVMIDHQGEVLDGDELLYIITEGLLHYQSALGGVVGTAMSNMGLELGIKKLGLEFLRVKVGDHHVIEGLLQKKWLLGGEPSGHVIYLPVTTTADGIITALQVLQAMGSSEINLHDLKAKLKKFPQQVMNVPHHGCYSALEDPKVIKILQEGEKKLGRYGRLLARYSGTEPMVRVMVEGESKELVAALLEDICSVIQDVVKK